MGLRIIPFLAFAFLWSTANAGCPTMCQCSDKLVSCIAELLEGVPNFESLEVGPEAIDLSGNSIYSIDATDFSFDGNAYVQYLNLSNNHIVDINEKAFSELTNVREISLNANFLDSVPPMFVADNKQLVSLDLSNNYFDLITPEIYSTSLEVLDLSYTKIVSFDESNIKYLPNLKVINLSYNRISSIEPSTFSNVPNLLAVDLTGNFWKCDQKTIDLFNFLTDNGLTDVIDPVKCITEEGFYQDIYTSTGPVDIFSISLEGFVNDQQPQSAPEAEQQENVVLDQQDAADVNDDNQQEDTEDVVNDNKQQEDTENAEVNGDNQQEDAEHADVNDDNQEEDAEDVVVNDDKQQEDTEDADVNGDDQQEDAVNQAVDEDGAAESENTGDEDNADEDADTGDNYQDDQYVNDDGLQDDNQDGAHAQSLEDLHKFLSIDDSFGKNIDSNDETDNNDEESDDNKKADEELGDKSLEELILEQTGKSNPEDITDTDVMDAIHKLLKEEEVDEDIGDDYGDDYWDNVDDDVKSEVSEQKVEEEEEDDDDDESEDVVDEETGKKLEDETKKLPDVSENPDESADMEISVIREDQYIVLLERGSADESHYGIYFTNNFFSTTLGIVMAMISIMLVLCLLYVVRESYVRRRRKEIHGSTNVLINKWSDDLA